MTGQNAAGPDFRGRLKNQDHLLGTFVKFPTTQAIEILGVVGFDFIVIDQEHAPLDRMMTDLMILAARASNMAAIVRVADGTDAHILNALDCGAAGVMVPHVSSVEKARAAARACRYRNGTRGFVGVSRASQWGRFSWTATMKALDAQVTCIAMIEDLEAVDRVRDIAMVEGIDALFLGRGDLTASFGDDPQAEAKVAEISAKVAAAASAAKIPLLVLAISRADALWFKKAGVSGLSDCERPRFPQIRCRRRLQGICSAARLNGAHPCAQKNA